MDLATLVGFFIGLAGLLGGFIEEGGRISMLLIISPFMIVFGGTFGAVIVSFTFDEIKKVPYFLKKVFTEKKMDYVSTLRTLVDMADRARREGLLSLESQLADIDNPYMSRGLQLVIDGTDPELARNMMEMEIEAYESQEKVGTDIFMSAGGFSPTMGIIGTVMGLVQVLSNLTDPDSLGPAIAAAFIATLYGVAAANVMWIPFGTKIKVKTGKEVLIMEMILEGILSIQAGENPRVIQEKLLTFVPQDIKMTMQEELN
jgi:chemotaxis protein MotA